MPSLQTKEDIWNAALDLLREQPLAGADDTSAVAKWLRRNHSQQTDYLLGRYYWKFAMKRALLAADPDAPAWGWLARYRMPADKIRLVPLTVDGQWNGKPISYEEEGDFLLCNVSGGLPIKYIGRVDNVGLFSNDFAELLSFRLAMRMAHWLSGKQSMFETLRKMYVDTLDEVKQAAAAQVPSDSYYDGDILDRRLP